MFSMLRRIRRIVRLVILLLILAALWQVYQWLGTYAKKDEVASVPAVSYEALNHTYLQGLWLSQYDLSPMMTENGSQREIEDYRERVSEAVAHIKENGLNTLFVQLRPNGDALYPSDLFPSSAYAVGQTGAPFSYDPFAVLLEVAHKEGLSVHAWINPLRLFREDALSALSDGYAHVGWCREAGDRAVLWEGVWYLNPAYTEVRELIAEGVREILLRYEVDGIHMDDYFYPTTSEDFDRQSYERYRREGGMLSRSDFRRNAVNGLVSLLWQTVHAEDGDRVFGISPSGNVVRNRNELYADTEYWCAGTGYVDYLCPQIYFGLGHESHDFLSVLGQFESMTDASRVKLYVGLTLAKAYDGYYGQEDRYAGSGSREWIEEEDVLARCLALIEERGRCEGVVFYSYRYLFSPESGERVVATETEWGAVLPYLLKNEKN